MAARFDSFGLEDLVARPEDAFRLCALAMAQGQRIRGYRGDYYRLYLGDAIVNLRTMTDPETGEEELLGMDTHAVSSCVWETKDWGLCPQEVDGERPPLGVPSKDPYICHGDPLQRWATYTQTKRISEDRTDVWTAVVSVVNADVLTWQSLGEPLRLNMAAFPRWVEYFTSEEDYASAQRKKPPYENLVLAPGDIYEAGTWAMSDAFMADRDHWPRRRGPEYPSRERDDVLLRGVVKDVRVGETYMGLERMTVFIRTTVSTLYGDLEICHPTAVVPEDQKNLVRPGARVSLLCAMVADAAVGRYEEGIEFGEAQDLLLLRHFFERGGADRLRPALRNDCEYVSEYSGSRLEGVEATVALLKDVESALDDESRYFAYPAHIVGVEADPSQEDRAAYGPGKACLLLAQGEPEAYVALCFIETDSLGRIRTLYLSRDGRYRFQRDDLPIQVSDAEPPADALEAMMPWIVMGGLLEDPDLLLADRSAFPAYEARAREGMEGALAAEDLDGALRTLFGALFQETAGGGAERGEALYEGFRNYPRLARPDPAAYRQQLLNALVLVQRLGALNRGEA